MEQNKKDKQVKPTISVICTINKLNEENNNIEYKKNFTIPPYQRLYAWKDEQIKALLDDFENCMSDETKPHFIGNIVVSEDDGKYVLIDGQQRLTTIWLVLRYLLRKDFDAKDYFDIEMPIREEDIQAINNYCDNEKSLDECFNDTNNTNAGFKNAFKIFEVYFGKDNEEYKQQVIKFITAQVKFNLVILGDQVELNKYFVRMNNTGVQLDGTDILKARLLKLISDYENNKLKNSPNEENEVTTYARIFDECSQMKYFADFDVLDNNTGNTIKPTIEKIIKNEEKLQNYSNNDKDRAEFESIIDFPTFVLHVFKILSKSSEEIFKEGTQISIKKDKFLENTWDKLNDDLDAEQVKIIINALKDYRIIFDTFVIKKKLIKDEDKAYYGFYNHSGDKLDSDKTSLYDLATIQNYLRVARRGDNANYYHFLTHYLEFCKNEIMSNEIMSEEGITRKKCLNKLKDSDNADKLINYLKSIDDFLALKQFSMENGENKQDLISIISEVPFNNTSFSEKTKDILESIKNLNFENTEKDKGKSNSNLENAEKDKDKPNFDFLNNGTNTPHYWFYRLEYYLLTGNHFKDENNEIKKDFKQALGSYRFRYVSSIEHVYPQHSKDGEELNADLDCFGNLALISNGENSEFSNKPFNEKQSQFDSYLKKGLVISLKLLDIYKINNEWKEEQIKAHQKAMLGVLQNSF